jgi:hypothetical protein
MAFRPLNLGNFDTSKEPLSSSLTKINDMIEELYTFSQEGDLGSISQNIVPDQDNLRDLGSADKKWRSLYVSGNTIYLGNSEISVDNQGNLSVNGESIAATTWENVLGRPDIPASIFDLDVPRSIIRPGFLKYDGSDMSWVELSTIAASGSYNDLFDTPQLATVATTGRFADLINTPTTLAGYGITDEISASVSVRIQNDAPTNPSLGDLWWESDTEKLKIYDDTGETPGWIDTSNKGIETVNDAISINSTNGEIVLRSVNNRVQIIAAETKQVLLSGGDILNSNPTPGGNIIVGKNYTAAYPAQITKSQSQWYQPIESNNDVRGGLLMRGDLIIGLGSRLCLGTQILFQDGTFQDTAYQGRELQQHTITSGVFYKNSIPEPASGIGWGGSDEFSHCVSIYGNHLVIGAPKYIADGDTHAAGRAHIYNLTTGALITTLNPLIVFEDRIDANFGAACASNNYAHFIGMPGTDGGFPNRAIGRVERYSVVNNNYFGFIFPSDYPEVGDMRFGASIAATENLVVVAAPDYPNPLGGTGRIYVYDLLGDLLLGIVDNPYNEGTYGTSLSIYQDVGVGQYGLFDAEVIVVGSNIAVSRVVIDLSDPQRTPYSQHSYENWTNPNPLDNNFGKFVGGNKNYMAVTSYHASEGMKVYVWDKRGGVTGDHIIENVVGQIDQTKRLKWIFTPPSSDPNNDFGKGLQLLEGDILAVAHPAAANGAGTILFYDLNTGTILNKVTLDLPNNDAQLGKNSVFLTDNYLIANAPGNGNAYVYDYQKTLISSASTKNKVLAADGFGGFGLKNPNYNDLIDKPIIPSDINELTDSGNLLNRQPSRTVVQATTGVLFPNQTGNISITGFKSYAILKITTEIPAWVRIYSDQASRTADASRTENQDPAPGAGVLAEIITTTENQTVLMTPTVIGFNNESPVTDIIPVAVTNKGTGLATIEVTLTILRLED